MSWKPLSRLRDRTIPKLYNLRRAARAGLRVPTTWWMRAADAAPGSPDTPSTMDPPPGSTAPWIVRSASPTEDTDSGTAAGQFVTCAVEEDDRDDFRAAVRAVVDALPRDAGGRPTGAVFVQPLLEPERGGVAFFDGFYYELTTAPGGNRELTAGRARGDVERGSLRRGTPWSDWLRRMARVFRRELSSGAALDIELALDNAGPVLLQARPARFDVRRNPLLSLANHREILGDPPSPWIVAALEEAGSDALTFFAQADPEVRRWRESYAVTAGGRAWINFSFFHRLMDHWGLPRTFVTEGVGGESDGPLDARTDLLRMIRKSPRLIGLQVRNVLGVLSARRSLAELDRRIAAASDLPALFDASVHGLGVALRVNFAINGALTGAVRIRRALGLRGRARVTTEEMMEAYEELGAVEPTAREDALDAWLARFGHRGPLESDLQRPRFAELRDVLLADLERAGTTPPNPTPAPGRTGGLLFALDRRRESFRDELMRSWARLRARILAAAGELVEDGALPSIEDVFLLTRADLATPPHPTELALRRAELTQLAASPLPTTATLDDIEQHLAAGAPNEPQDADSFHGIPLSDTTFEGRVRKADDLVTLLRSESLTPDTVLVVPALEPSWAVVFGRVGGVVAELGGELSHASILLREARKPAVVNCSGIFAALNEGARVRIDGRRGVVERLVS